QDRRQAATVEPAVEAGQAAAGSGVEDAPSGPAARVVRGGGGDHGGGQSGDRAGGGTEQGAARDRDGGSGDQDRQEQAADHRDRHRGDVAEGQDRVADVAQREEGRGGGETADDDAQDAEPDQAAL